VIGPGLCSGGRHCDVPLGLWAVAQCTGRQCTRRHKLIAKGTAGSMPEQRPVLKDLCTTPASPPVRSPLPCSAHTPARPPLPGPPSPRRTLQAGGSGRRPSVIVLRGAGGSLDAGLGGAAGAEGRTSAPAQTSPRLSRPYSGLACTCCGVTCHRRCCRGPTTGAAQAGGAGWEPSFSGGGARGPLSPITPPGGGLGERKASGASRSRFDDTSQVRHWGLIGWLVGWLRHVEGLCGCVRACGLCPPSNPQRSAVSAHLRKRHASRACRCSWTSRACSSRTARLQTRAAQRRGRGPPCCSACCAGLRPVAYRPSHAPLCLRIAARLD
jgi:hypothetical protein